MADPTAEVLPDACMVEVLCLLSPRDLLAAMASCKRFWALGSSLETHAGHSVAAVSAKLNQLHRMLHGEWKSVLYEAAKDRAQNPATRAQPSAVQGRVEFSAFCVPDASTITDSSVLVTDGYGIQYLDSEASMVQGHIAPQFPLPAHRQAQAFVVGHAVPTNTVPDMTRLRLLLLQPQLHGAKHIQQYLQSPDMFGTPDTWPPRTLLTTQRGHGTLHSLLADTVTGGGEPRSSGSSSGAVWRPRRPVQQQQDPRPGNSSGLRTAAEPLPTEALSAVAGAGPPPRASGVAVVVPRAPRWEAQRAQSAMGSGGGGGGGGVGSGSGRHSRSQVDRSHLRRPSAACGERVIEGYDTQADLSFQLLSKALALQSITYLDVSHSSELKDSDITLVLTKASRELKHLVARGTQTGPLSLMTLASNGRMNLTSLDLSHSLHVSSFRPHAPEPTSPHGTPPRRTAHRPARPAALPSSATQPPAGSLACVSPAGSTQGASVSSTTVSHSPPVGLVSGLTVMDQGLRHRHPSQLANATTAPNTVTTSPSQLHADASTSSMGDSRAAAGVGRQAGMEGLPGATGLSAGGSLWCRLLRAALGRLTNLTELHLAGNDLTGLLDPVGSVNSSSHSQCRNTSGSSSGPASAQEPPHTTWEQPLLSTLGRLQTLDLSQCLGLTQPHLHMLLEVCANLHTLRLMGCRSLALPSSSAPATASSAAVAALPTVACQLRHLSCGWGFSSTLLQHVFAHSPCLLTFEAGLGACASDDVLKAAAQLCPHLTRVKLKLSAVTGSGVQALLQGCTKLHVLHLNQCVGPFTAAMLPTQEPPSSPSHSPPPPSFQHPPSPSHTVQPQSPRAPDQPKPHRCTLTELVIQGPPVHLTDTHLKQLIGPRQHTLTTLALTRCTHLTPAALSWLGVCHGQSLRHIMLDGCGGGAPAVRPSNNRVTGRTDMSSQQRSSNSADARTQQSHPAPLLKATQCDATCECGTCGQSRAESSTAAVVPTTVTAAVSASAQTQALAAQAASSVSGGVIGAGKRTFVWRWSETDVLTLLSKCPGLRSLSIRHCCQLSSSFVEQAAERCPLLGSVTLDQCDLAEGGVTLTQSPYSPLQQVQVMRCKQVDDGLLLGSPRASEPDSTTLLAGHAGTVAGGHDAQVSDHYPSMQRRRVDHDMLVHDFLAGRTHTVEL